MKLYNIYWTDSYGDKSLQATTNNCEKWLENNNKGRPPCSECDGEGTVIYKGKKEECDYCEGSGNDDESLDDFEIEEIDAYIYEKPLYVMHYIDDNIGLDFECVTTDVDAYLDEYNEERGFQPRDFDEDKDNTDDYDGEFVGRDYFDIQEA